MIQYLDRLFPIWSDYKTEFKQLPGKSMKNKSIPVPILTLIILLFLLSSCAGGQLAASGWPGITADDEAAYIAYNQQVYSINLTNGLELWRYPVEPDNNITFYAAPALTNDGQVIAGGYDNILYSLDAQTGQQNWKFEQAKDRFIGSSLIADEMIFSPSSDADLFAINFQGQPVWSEPFKTENSNWSKPAADPNCECVYLASMDHSVYAIEPTNGRELWRSESLGGATVGTPTISEDGKTLYIGTFLNELVAIDTSNGAILWRFPTDGWVWASPVLAGETLYFGDIAGNFYAIDRNTQATLWSIQSGSDIVGTPLLTDDGIYFTNEAGTLFALTKAGATRWTKEFGATLHTGPVAAGDLILVATDENGLFLYAIDSEGLQKWQFSPSEE
jgi:outer membrane protein assembly factor BamB